MKKIVSFIGVVLLFCVLIANVDTKFSNKFKEIKGLGVFIRAFDIRGKLSDNFEQKSNSEEISSVNAKDTDIEEAKNIEKFTQQARKVFWQNREEESYDETDLLKNLSKDDVIEEIITNNENWFVVKFVMANIAGGSNVFQECYNINKKTGEIVELSDLFEDNSYIEIISEEIKSQIAEQKKQDENITYFEDIVDELKIRPDHNFYINSQNKLVIVFHKYEIAPGANGCPEFEITTINYKLKN